MRYHGCAGCVATPTGVQHLQVTYVYSDRPLTDQERLLARLWLRDRVTMAAITLLSLRLDTPKLTEEQILQMEQDDIHAFLVGLHLSVREDYLRQAALDRLEGLDPHKEIRH